MIESIAPGLCHCGCGEPAPVATRNRYARGQIKGQPLRYIQGHSVIGVGEKTRFKSEAPCDYVEEDRGHDTPCRIWQRATNDRGYGQLRIKGRTVYAHRHFFEEAFGPIPASLELHHLCEQPPCIRSDHLEPLTHRQHFQLYESPKLDHRKVGEMEALYGAGWLIVEIAERYDLHPSYVGRVLRGEKWAI